MKFTKKELIIMKNHLFETLLSAYKLVNISNAKELAFAPLKDFNSEEDIKNTQSALKKVIEEIVNDQS